MAIQAFAVLAFASLVVTSVVGDVLVLDRESGAKLRIFRDASSTFGQAVPEEDGLTGRVVETNPRNACIPIEPAPRLHEDKVPYIAIIARYGGCNFQEKVKAAQAANFSAAIVYNINSDKLVPMGGEDEDAIPSVFIGYTDAEIILRAFTYPDNKRVVLLVTGNEPFDINSYLLPFAIVVGICFVLMLGILLFKCLRDHRRSRRHRLPKSALKRLPVIKFKTGDPYETCCICLDDFAEGDKLRILPCEHGYHSKCIDPWLVKNKRICPQCRKRVFQRGDSSDSEDDERAPLLANQRGGRRRTLGGGGGGTFESSSAPTAIATGTPIEEEEEEDDEEVVDDDDRLSLLGAVGGVRRGSSSSRRSGSLASAAASSCPTPVRHSVIVHAALVESVPEVHITSEVAVVSPPPSLSSSPRQDDAEVPT